LHASGLWSVGEARTRAGLEQVTAASLASVKAKLRAEFAVLKWSQRCHYFEAVCHYSSLPTILLQLGIPQLREWRPGSSGFVGIAIDMLVRYFLQVQVLALLNY